MVKIVWKRFRISKKFSFFMIFISAFLYVFSIQIFLRQAQAFSNGLSAFAIFLTLIPGLKSYFSIFYFALNLPLIALFWKRVRKSFMYKTAFFLLAQLIMGFFFWIPHFNEKMDNFFIDYKDSIWSGIFFAGISGVICGFAIGISWKYGGSCAGTDIIAYYYSTKRKRPVSTIIFIAAVSFALFSTILSIIFFQDERSTIFSRVYSTFIFILISSLLVEKIYPKYSKIEINIHSNKINEIINFFEDSKFCHAFQVQDFFSPYMKKNRKSIKSVVFLLELKPLVNKLREIDPNIWISTNRVTHIWGKFNTQSID